MAKLLHLLNYLKKWKNFGVILMIIEILEQGGIYAYYLKDKCIYIGKTTRPFSERDNEHKNGITPFDKFYKQNPTFVK